jgi:outer membrane protein assembly factor BamE (lipoprotein component of BamABCDE complex)
MVITIKKGATKEEVEKQLAKLKPKKNKIGLREFLGKPIFDEKVDAVAYQKMLRNE